MWADVANSIYTAHPLSEQRRIAQAYFQTRPLNHHGRIQFAYSNELQIKDSTQFANESTAAANWMIKADSISERMDH
jgi:hypothetical protein